jgi:hypothetical protein
VEECQKKPHQKQNPRDEAKQVSPYPRSTIDLLSFVWVEPDQTVSRCFDSPQHLPPSQPCFFPISVDLVEPYRAGERHNFDSPQLRLSEPSNPLFAGEKPKPGLELTPLKVRSLGNQEHGPAIPGSRLVRAPDSLEVLPN